MPPENNVQQTTTLATRIKSLKSDAPQLAAALSGFGSEDKQPLAHKVLDLFKDGKFTQDDAVKTLSTYLSAVSSAVAITEAGDYNTF